MSLWNVDDYVRLRSGGDDPALAAFAQRADLAGKDVLDLGCGPGRAAAALADRYGARVTAVDASPEMVDAARKHAPMVDVHHARAEELPFDADAFDAVISLFVVHLLDRQRAFPEVRRVLRRGGTFFVKTDDPDTLEDYWTVPLFPSYVSIERERFPSEERLRAELTVAGFEHVAVDRLRIDREFSRAEALEKLGSSAYSTLRLIPPDELAEGIRRAPEVLADPVRYRLTLMTIAAG